MTCDTCKHWRSGCTLSEALLDGRGEPTVGNPQACGYFEEAPAFVGAQTSDAAVDATQKKLRLCRQNTIKPQKECGFADAEQNALRERLNVLHQRFSFDAKQLEDSAANWTDHYLAQVFRRCCDDLGLVLGGETPPPPGIAWKKQERPE